MDGFFVRGLLIGLAIAAPVGPIGVLCIQRTIQYGTAAGFVTGLGAATADALYGAVAAFGLTSVSAVLVGEQFWIRVLGGAFLVWLGLKTLLRKPAADAVRISEGGFLWQYLTTALLTLANPTTILSFVAIFAGLGLAGAAAGVAAGAALTAGVFFGSAAWWLILSNGVGLFRARLGAVALRAINVLSGLVLLGFATAACAAVLGNDG